ncbi:MAG TPA: hypothetical protein VMO88_02775 [Acidimicrobiales bacterium]|nr:hypothetical protein [Acidimicrobiales bacterium]
MRRAALWAASLGAALEGFGASWDIAWHGDVGRDRFLTPPHEVILSGIVLLAVGCGVGLWSVRRLFPGAGSPAPGFALAGAAAVLQAVGLAVDNWWHGIFGVDVTLWSPPHLLLLALAWVAVAGLMSEHAAAGIRHQATRAVWAGALLASMSLVLYEYDLGFPHFGLIWSPWVLAGCLGFALGVAGGSWSSPFAGTIAVATALALRLAAVGLNASEGRSLPVLPLGILAGGLAFDVARVFMRRRQTLVHIATASAVAWIVTFPAQAAWLQLAGKTWWPRSILAGGLVLGLLIVVSAAAAGVLVGRRLLGSQLRGDPLVTVMRGSTALPAAGGREVTGRRMSRPRRWAIGIAGIGAVVGVASFTYTPTGFAAATPAKDATIEARPAAFTLDGATARLWIRGARQSDWVSVFTIPAWGGQGVRWAGGLTLGNGGYFSGAVHRKIPDFKSLGAHGGQPFMPELDPFGTGLAIWLTSGGQAWAGYVDVLPPGTLCIGACGGDVSFVSNYAVSVRYVDGNGPVRTPAGAAKDVIQTTLFQVASVPPGHPAAWLTPFAYFLVASVLGFVIALAVLLFRRRVPVGL